ncbi:MAG TPA: hypothetical protein VMC83_27525 [Streptosporangiaceae bacterium]|nr:hypothetical protein [Streptosporangiaceae bacterium]
MRHLTRSVALLLAALATGLLVAGCGSGVSSAIKSLAPSKSISVPSFSPSPAPAPTAQPTAEPSPTVTTPPASEAAPVSSPTPSRQPRPAPTWLWWLVGIVVVIGLIVVAWVVHAVTRRHSMTLSAWRARAIDAYAKGSALYDAMSFAERPGALDAADSGARWADVQRRADDLAQTLYAMREAAPNEDERARVADALVSLQAVRSAMDAERAPGGASAQQAEVVRGRLSGFDAALRALRPPAPGVA